MGDDAVNGGWADETVGIKTDWVSDVAEIVLRPRYSQRRRLPAGLAIHRGKPIKMAGGRIVSVGDGLLHVPQREYLHPAAIWRDRGRHTHSGH